MPTFVDNVSMIYYLWLAFSVNKLFDKLQHYICYLPVVIVDSSSIHVINKYHQQNKSSSPKMRDDTIEMINQQKRIPLAAAIFN